MAEVFGNMPPPPELQFAIRTMESDLKSLKQSGGQGVAPQFFNAKYSIRKEDSETKEEEVVIPGYTGPEKSIFNTSSPVRAGVPGAASSETKGTGKIIFIAVGATILVLGFAYLGYAIVFPWIFK